MEHDAFMADISRHIWDSKYRSHDARGRLEADITDTWHRVARALASVESSNRAQWAQRFYAALEDFKFLPGGRIQAAAGTARRVTLFNCFVMGRIKDSMDGIFDALKEGALTLQQGGGVGYDFPHCARPACWRRGWAWLLPDRCHSCTYGMRCAPPSFPPVRGVAR